MSKRIHHHRSKYVRVLPNIWIDHPRVGRDWRHTEVMARRQGLISDRIGLPSLVRRDGQKIARQLKRLRKS